MCDEALSWRRIEHFCWAILDTNEVFRAFHRISLTVHFSCNSFARIQEVVMNQTGHRSSNYHYDLLLVKFWLWEMLWSFVLIQSMSRSSPIITKNPFFIARYNSFEKMNHFYCAKEEQMIFQNDFFYVL